MVVSTTLREVSLGHDDDALLRLAEGHDRRATPHPAAPEGLFLAHVGYEPLKKLQR